MTKINKSFAVAIILTILSSGMAVASDVGSAKITSIVVNTKLSTTPIHKNSLVSDKIFIPATSNSTSFEKFSLKSKKNFSFSDTMFNTSLVSLTALNIADLISTIQALKFPNLYEANPIMKHFVNKPLLFTGVKLGITALDILLIKKVYKKSKVLGWAISLTFNFALSYFVANNFKLVRQASQVHGI